uniref:Uncharacterized protein n=1 Tax=Arundo donax TaxID=35708 RepID=A0A0A9AA36_ARUDO
MIHSPGMLLHGGKFQIRQRQGRERQ